ncbi:tail fiber protein [Stappia sp. ES.058]|uniref:tail fiber protein n=1 Tax=Stappia sp. ES.058 TaxID=1881061 RepID=UPI000879D8CF|nr:tail fiber protein [Stappia sp. ES.058]SDU08373.1 Microcystin-dependent protein [Stappia sp. ES.058]
MPTPTTANRGYPLPHPENELDTDVQRLVSALQSIDADVASLLISVSQAALGTHGHVIGDVTGLQAALDAKAAANHTHAINDLTDVDITGAPAGRPLTTKVGGGVGIGPDWSTAIAGKLSKAGGQMTGDLETSADILAGASSRGTIGRAGWSGNYSASKIQGIWSIGDQYRVDLAANDFGDHFGLVYGYHSAGSGVENKLPIADWGHQILLTSAGVPFIGFSMTYGHGWFAGNVGIGKLPEAENRLDVAGRVNADEFTIAGQPLPTGAPAGSIMPFATSTPPAGWLVCNGASVSRATYTDLFATVGTTFGSGDGSTTFNLPDLRGEFVRGWDNGRGVDNGRAFGSAQGDELGEHKHISMEAASGSIGGGNAGADAGTGPTNTSGRHSITYANTTYEAHETGLAGGSETRPRNVALLWCIKAFDVVLDPAQVSAASVVADVASNADRIDALESAPAPVISGYYESAPTSVAANTTYTFAHDLGRKPAFIQFFAYCYATGSYAYGASVGDEARCTNPEGSGVRWYADDTNIYIPFGAVGGSESFSFKMHTGSGVTLGLPNSAMAPHWKLIVRAFG